MFTKLRGTIVSKDDNTELSIAVYAGPYFFIGGVLSFFGVIGLLLCMAKFVSHWLAWIGLILFGFLMICHSLWNGISILQSIQHKLCN